MDKSADSVDMRVPSNRLRTKEQWLTNHGMSPWGDGRDAPVVGEYYRLKNNAVARYVRRCETTSRYIHEFALPEGAYFTIKSEGSYFTTTSDGLYYHIGEQDSWDVMWQVQNTSMIREWWPGYVGEHGQEEKAEPVANKIDLSKYEVGTIVRARNGTYGVIAEVRNTANVLNFNEYNAAYTHAVRWFSGEGGSGSFRRINSKGQVFWYDMLTSDGKYYSSVDKPFDIVEIPLVNGYGPNLPVIPELWISGEDKGRKVKLRNGDTATIKRLAWKTSRDGAFNYEVKVMHAGAQYEYMRTGRYYNSMESNFDIVGFVDEEEEPKQADTPAPSDHNDLVIPAEEWQYEVLLNECGVLTYRYVNADNHMFDNDFLQFANGMQFAAAFAIEYIVSFKLVRK